MWKVFDLVPGWVYAAVCAVLLLVAGGFYVLYAREQVKFAAFKTEVAEATKKAEEEARAAERNMQRKAERIARDATKREKELAGRVATAANAAASLRDQINALNARPAPADPQSAALAVEARTARELLGTCSDRYRAVAATADGLAAQVTGLQQFTAEVCNAPKD